MELPEGSPVRLTRRTLGRTDVAVTCLGLGGGALGGLYEPVTETAACSAVEHAYKMGIRYFDTAPLYGHGRSEERLGRVLEGYDRASFVLSTKVGIMIEPLEAKDRTIEERYADPFLIDGRYDFSYDACLRSLEASMRRLRTDRIDVVYIHDPDEGNSLLPPPSRQPVDHFKEVLEGAYKALHELRAQGVIGAIGVGLNGTGLLAELARAGDFNCFLLAGRYTLLEQGGLDDLFPVCRERGVSIVVGGVFNSGILALGSSDSKSTYNYDVADPEMLARVRELEAVCSRHGVTLPAAALQFPLAQDVVAAVIPGARSLQEVDANLSHIAQEIPPPFWKELTDENLIDFRAPVPGSPPVVLNNR